MPPKTKTDDVKADETAKDAPKTEDGADAAQVAGQPDPDLKDDEVKGAGDGQEPDADLPVTDGMCPEHFPLGWNSTNVTRTEAATGVRSPRVTCEHGSYDRPADK